MKAFEALVNLMKQQGELHEQIRSRAPDLPDESIRKILAVVAKKTDFIESQIERRLREIPERDTAEDLILVSSRVMLADTKLLVSDLEKELFNRVVKGSEWTN